MYLVCLAYSTYEWNHTCLSACNLSNTSSRSTHGVANGKSSSFFMAEQHSTGYISTQLMQLNIKTTTETQMKHRRRVWKDSFCKEDVQIAKSIVITWELLQMQIVSNPPPLPQTYWLWISGGGCDKSCFELLTRHFTVLWPCSHPESGHIDKDLSLGGPPKVPTLLFLGHLLK